MLESHNDPEVEILLVWVSNVIILNIRPSFCQKHYSALPWDVHELPSVRQETSLEGRIQLVEVVQYRRLRSVQGYRSWLDRIQNYIFICSKKMTSEEDLETRCWAKFVSRVGGLVNNHTQQELTELDDCSPKKEPQRQMWCSKSDIGNFWFSIKM